MAALSKLKELQAVIRKYQSVLVAFSGGIDSALVLKVSRDVLGRDFAKAVTAKSESIGTRELEAAKALAEAMDVEHRIVQTHELHNPSYAANPTNRCYFCKTELYDMMLPIAKEWGISTIANGTNLDDLGDFRPGHSAAGEHGIKSPLVEAGLRKDEIRSLSRELGLKIWDKPASPCLSSRFPYGHEITTKKLRQVEMAEDFLKDLGFKLVRVRHLGVKARVELGREEWIEAMDVGLRSKMTEFILSLGFRTVVFEPYRSGNLNRMADAVEREQA
ncbi:MAG: ATP-dependent sacrificial sulfur transferase LarE [Candidatus Omnitrophica bacterium]|nr:ATP-dependent sacrificial sulfur transferase LarE [Candidatus Omnitrophota bacterium]